MALSEQKQKVLLKTARILLVAALLTLLIVAVVKILPLALQIFSGERSIDELRMQLQSIGAGGIFVIMLIQFIQVVVPIIPALPIQVVAGMCYGVVVAFMICAVSVIAATVLVFYLSRRLGMLIIQTFFKEKQLHQFKFLQNTQRLEGIVLILYFIPTLPKEMFTYLSALTPIKPMHFFVISSLARLPAMFSTIFAGYYFIQGDYLYTAVVFVITTLVALLGMVFYRQYIKRLEKKQHPNAS